MKDIFQTRPKQNKVVDNKAIEDKDDRPKDPDNNDQGGTSVHLGELV